ncbi:RNA polymerase sigma factor [Streptomyces sp. NBC_00334]|uniref:RNA polymerase sigma factor n=1 Tax=Streptomyces sp. NBC_00334 TaxID=2975713 RepID=UPI002E2E873F|nr:sigma factor [Streptomyces sp. NBC_00334]
MVNEPGSVELPYGLSVEQLRACENLHASIAPSLMAMLRSDFNLSTPDGEDIVQVAFEKILPRWAELDPARAAGYVRQTAKNLARDLFRRRQREERANRNWLDNARIGSTSPDLDPPVAAALDRAIAGLDPKQCATLAHQLDGREDAEIAALLSVAPATVRSNRRKAIPNVRRALVKELEKDGE